MKTSFPDESLPSHHGRFTLPAGFSLDDPYLSVAWLACTEGIARDDAAEAMAASEDAATLASVSTTAVPPPT